MANRQPECFDIETFMAVSPLAMLALVGLSFDLLRVSKVFSEKLLVKVVCYVTGMIVLDRGTTANKIADWLGGVSHDQLTRMLASEGWKCSEVMIGLIRLVQRFGVKGMLIIDDTLLPHPRSKKMDAVYWDFDHAEGRNVFGQRLVMIIWTDGFWRIPVAFAFWHKKGKRPKYRTKNEIARTLLEWVVSRGIRPDCVSFDNWYASIENIKLVVEDLGLDFVTRVKRNMRLTFEWRRLQARTIGSRLLKGVQLPEGKRTGRICALAAVVRVPGMKEDHSMMTFVVVKEALDGDLKPFTRYLLTSALGVSASEVVRRYKQRWTIEVFFRDLKQHLSGKDHRGRSLVAAEHHIACACLAGVVLDHIRLETDMSPDQAKQFLQRLVFIDTPSDHFRLAVLRPTPADSLDQLDEAKQALRSQLFRVTTQRLRTPLSPFADAA